jgi:hypothetical protein
MSPTGMSGTWRAAPGLGGIAISILIARRARVQEVNVRDENGLTLAYLAASTKLVLASALPE